jgi:hypothetical protein
MICARPVQSLSGQSHSSHVLLVAVSQSASRLPAARRPSATFACIARLRHLVPGSRAVSSVPARTQGIAFLRTFPLTFVRQSPGPYERLLADNAILHAPDSPERFSELHPNKRFYFYLLIGNP